MNVLLNIKPTDVTRNIHAVKVLAMNDRGRQYLKHLKQRSQKDNIQPILTKVMHITSQMKSKQHTYTMQ